MNRILSVIVSLILFIPSSHAGGFKYTRELTPGISIWNQITIPQEMYEKTSNDFSDIRIYKLNPEGDSTEIPYSLLLAEPEVQTEDRSFKINNESFAHGGWYYTFRLDEVKTVNEIKLNFQDENFDKKVLLEGSFDQDEWFKVLKEYRIFSIKNDFSEYRFTTLRFKDSNFRFYRLFIPGENKLAIKNASVTNEKTFPGDFAIYHPKELKVEKKNSEHPGQTTIKVRLDHLVPVSRIKLFVHDSIDYYRPIAVRTITDTLKADKTAYNYSTLYSGILSSLDPMALSFKTEIVNNLEIIVSDFDNESLTIDSVEVSGYVYKIIGRFKGDGQYILAYGNHNLSKPKYDIEYFSTKLSKELNKLECGPETFYREASEAGKSKNFFDKYWLWGVIITAIVLLGAFTRKMLK